MNILDYITTMSSLFDIEVLSKTDNTVELKLYIIHPHQYWFYESKSFALQLIWDLTKVIKQISCPLSKEISAEKILDIKWVINNQDKFIKSVMISETLNYPIDLDYSILSEEEYDKHWEDKKSLAQAIYLITVTNPKWIKHIQNGMEYETAAYDMEKLT